jgi:CDP-diacylglycerol--serine O-phosphatidyltransferase
MFVVVAAFIYLIYHYSKPLLLAIGVTYVSAGVIIRIGGIIRRLVRRPGTTVSQT